MKITRIKNLLAAALVGVLTLTALAQNVAPVTNELAAAHPAKKNKTVAAEA